MDAPDAGARLLLLGAPQLVRGEGVYALPDSLPGYLVAFLAHRGDWVPREHLATLLWPDATEEEAQHNLRVNLNRLRPHLRTWGIEAALLAERRRLRLLLPADTGDQRAALAAGNWFRAADLPRGQFLHGLTFRAFAVLGEWARAQRDELLARWREAILAAAPPLAPAAAAALAARFREHDPFDEEVLRVQLAALAALGRGAETQRTFEVFRERAAAELGVAPSTSLLAFAQGLRATPSDTAPAAFDDEALIGRDVELARLQREIGVHRIVTLVGIGGAGKTRLARALVQAVADRYAGGAWWIDAAQLSGPAELPRRIADILQLEQGGGAEPVLQIAHRIGAQRALLVLDNAEVLLEEREQLRATLHALIETCPSLQVLVTAREPLQIEGETRVPLEGLALPAEDPAQALESPAVRLFVSQARRLRPNFDPRPVAAALADIARLTGGIPLALRLAAAWLRVLPCAAIADELRRGLAVLDGSDSAGMRATLDRSWSRLDGRAQEALAQLAVFAGGFDVEAARVVAGVDLPLLAQLLERSMLGESNTDAAVAFELHPLVRAFALERLAVSARSESRAREQHAVLVARRLNATMDHAPDATRLAAVGRQLADAGAAWKWACGSGRADLLVQLVPPLLRYFSAKGRWEDGIGLFAAAAAQLDPQDRKDLAALAMLGRARGNLLYGKSDYDAAEAVLLDALRAARTIEHRSGVRECLITLGSALWMQGRYAEARACIEEARDLANGDGDTRIAAECLASLARLHKVEGDFAGAERLWRSALEINRSLGEWERAANMLNNLGNLVRGQRQRYDDARELLEEGLRLCDEHGFAAARPFLLINLALVHNDAGRHAKARSFAELALADGRRAGERMIVGACLLVLAYLTLREHDLPGAAGHLIEALRHTRALGDLQNQLEALDGFGRWLAERGESTRAAALWVAIERHPKLQGELRTELQKRWQELALAPQARERAERDADAIDLVAATELAIRELEQYRSLPPG